jgi:hypothetical protein
MTGRQTDKYMMLQVVYDYLKDTDVAVIDQMPGMAGLIDELEGLLAAVSVENQNQNRNTTGFRVEKVRMRGELTAMILDVAYCLKAYSVTVKDTVLKNEVDLKGYKIDKLREHEVVSVGTFIRKKANGLLAELAPYGITAALLADFEDAIVEYRSMIPKSRLEITNKMQSTSSIKDLLKALDVVIADMDVVVRAYRILNKGFCDLYFDTRKIITRGTRKVALQGSVVNEQEEALRKVTISIASHTVIETQTGEKGNFLFRRVPSGVWPVTFSRPGFESVTIYMAFVPQSRQEQHVVLKRQVLMGR